MNDANPTLFAPPPRLMLLSRCARLDGTLRRCLGEHPAHALQRSEAPQATAGHCALTLLDVGSYPPDRCAQLLRQLDDSPIALVNAEPEQAQWLIETHPWIRGVFYRATRRETFLRGLQAMLAGGDWLPQALLERLLSRHGQADLRPFGLPVTGGLASAEAGW